MEDGLLPELEFADALPGARFREFHQRTIAASIDEIWPHCLAVTGREVRALGPLMALRMLPSRLRRRKGAAVEVGQPRRLIDEFVGGGFVLLRHDVTPETGRAVVILGAAGRFWSLGGNSPRSFESAQTFLDFDEPGFAKTIARLEAVDVGDGTTRVETETWVHGTDAPSTRKFAPYWAVIRLPSGLIRRSWLAAIERRHTG